jgi:three-Cys-motif partner protein
VSKEHRFGGDWTGEKLRLVARYLRAYTTALKNQRFTTGYIDAFAGTGYLTTDTSGDVSPRLFDGFPDLAGPEAMALRDGSARLALQIEPRFDRYVFIERSSRRCKALESLKGEFPALAKDIRICQGEANAEIRALCEKDWSRHRAVLFLDPYGMQVEWATIEAVGRTQAIDLWVLFPLGMGVNRLLPRSGQVPEAWRNRLNLLLGTEAWLEEFYRVEEEPAGLFDSPVDEPKRRVVKASMATIGRFFVDRLGEVFADVAREPRVLKNSGGSPLYLLCFAAGNPQGAPIAVRIADHLLRSSVE